jgi:hypothetical protein
VREAFSPELPILTVTRLVQVEKIYVPKVVTEEGMTKTDDPSVVSFRALQCSKAVSLIVFRVVEEEAPNSTVFRVLQPLKACCPMEIKLERLLTFVKDVSL